MIRKLPSLLFISISLAFLLLLPGILQGHNSAFAATHPFQQRYFSLSPTEYHPYQTITVSFSVQDLENNQGSYNLYMCEDADLTHDYFKGDPYIDTKNCDNNLHNGFYSGTWTVPAPVQPGNYMFVMLGPHLEVGYFGSEVIQDQQRDFETFTVTPYETRLDCPGTTQPGGNVTVSWEDASVHYGAWIGFYDKDAPDNQPRQKVQLNYLPGNQWTVTAPVTPGQYSFRIFQDGQYIKTGSRELVVAHNAPTLNVSPAAEVRQGDNITVSWSNGPPYDNSGHLDIYHQDEYYRQITHGVSTSQEIQVMIGWSMPPGLYHVRMYAGATGEDVLLGVSNSFAVIPSSSTATNSDQEVTGGHMIVSASPSELYPGEYLTVSWNKGVPQPDNEAHLDIYHQNEYYKTILIGELHRPGEFQYMIGWHMPPGMYQARIITGTGNMAGASNSFVVTPSSSSSTAGGGGGNSTVGAGSISLQVGSESMTVGGVSQEIDPGQGTAPVIVNGRTFVPIRAIVEAMGGTMGWNGTERKVTIVYQGTIVELSIGGKTARVNGQDKPLDEAPFISSTGRTMLPLRFVTENLGSQVQWDGANQTITITSGGVSQTPPTTTQPPAASTQPPTSTQPPATSTPAAAAADFTGAWDMTVNGEAGHRLVLTQNGNNVTGYSGYDQESGHAFSGTVSGSTLSGKFHTTNPVTEWEFTVTMAADGKSFDGTEYYSNPPWAVHGVKAGAVSPQVIDFSGTWKLNVNGEDMGNDYCLVLQQNGTSVTGYCGYDPESGHAFTGTVSGNNLNGKFHTTNPVSEWEFKVTMTAGGNSFEGTEYYSNPPWAVYGKRK